MLQHGGVNRLVIGDGSVGQHHVAVLQFCADVQGTVCRDGRFAALHRLDGVGQLLLHRRGVAEAAVLFGLYHLAGLHDLFLHGRRVGFVHHLGLHCDGHRLGGGVALQRFHAHGVVARLHLFHQNGAGFGVHIVGLGVLLLIGHGENERHPNKGFALFVLHLHAQVLLHGGGLQLHRDGLGGGFRGRLRRGGRGLGGCRGGRGGRGERPRRQCDPHGCHQGQHHHGTDQNFVGGHPVQLFGAEQPG